MPIAQRRVPRNPSIANSLRQDFSSFPRPPRRALRKTSLKSAAQPARIDDALAGSPRSRRHLRAQSAPRVAAPIPQTSPASPLFSKRLPASDACLKMSQDVPLLQFKSFPSCPSPLVCRELGNRAHASLRKRTQNDPTGSSLPSRQRFLRTARTKFLQRTQARLRPALSARPRPL